MAETGETAIKRPRIGYLGGGDHQSGYFPDDEGALNKGSTDVYHLRERRLDSWTRVQIPRNYLRLARKHDFNRFNILLNLITDPDQNPKTLGILVKVLKGFKGRLLNRPEAVLATTRDEVAIRLRGIDGLIAPAVARFRGNPRAAASAIERAGVTFPAILRHAGAHSGRIVGVLHSAEEVGARILPEGQYFLTSFVDTRRADGLYRKMRVFVLGGTPVIRHHLISDRWNIHAADRTRTMAGKPALVAEEAAVVEGGIDALPAKARAALAEINARMRLEMFGIDLTMLDNGTLVLFEANPTMNFFPLSDDPQFVHLEVARARAANAFTRLLHPNGAPEAAA